MASARKKLDEKNLKILRELASLPENKHCFDCHQRGPTYVNVTIGSFVCTTCSGMLRGLTPPHRVKSISMATFTSEEIDFLKSRGNEYCRKVWLGLYSGEPITKDEQQIKEFMISKYERKRYYVKPSETDKVSSVSLNSSSSSSNATPVPKLPSSSSFQFPVQTMNNNISRNHNNNLFASQTFAEKPKEAAKVLPQDPFGSLTLTGPPAVNQPPAPVNNFANFDNNPIFNNPPVSQNSAPPVSTPMNNKVTQGPAPPSEDRYAALKDLDCLMKSQQTTLLTENTPAAGTSEWNAGNVWVPQTNGQTNHVSNPTNLFDATPQVFSPSSTKDFNPFVTSNSESAWGNTFGGNPFNTDFSWGTSNGTTNGLPVSQSQGFISSKPLWDFGPTPNPFSVGTNGQSISHRSSNPFL